MYFHLIELDPLDSNANPNGANSEIMKRGVKTARSNQLASCLEGVIKTDPDALVRIKYNSN